MTARQFKLGQRRSIYCTGCQCDVDARLTNGAEVYPRRRDLHSLPFWRCDACGNWVGCHHKTNNPTNPLGVIPTPEIKNARQHIHKILDPLWKSGRFKRREVYRMVAERLSIKDYHTANLRSVEEARAAYAAIQSIAKGKS